MENAPASMRSKGGRRLSFNRDVALRKAMLLFWRHGYEGTSLNALTAALGVTPPSIYAAFGDKQRLFMEAVELYLSGGLRAEQVIDQAATARAAAGRMLSLAAVGFTGDDTPSGCLLATSAISCSKESAEVQAALAAMRGGIEQHLCQRISRGVATGELPPGTNAASLAGLVMAVIQGMSTLARDGASRTHLLAIAEQALAGWPPEPGDPFGGAAPSSASTLTSNAKSLSRSAALRRRKDVSSTPSTTFDPSASTRRP